MDIANPELICLLAILITPAYQKAETAGHGRWLYFIFFILTRVATGFYLRFYHCRLKALACGFNVPFPHFDFVILGHTGQPTTHSPTRTHAYLIFNQ